MTTKDKIVMGIMIAAVSAIVIGLPHVVAWAIDAGIVRVVK